MENETRSEILTVFFSTNAVTSCSDEAVVNSKEDFVGILQGNESEAAGREKFSVLAGYILRLCCTLAINLCHIFLYLFPLPKTV